MDSDDFISRYPTLFHMANAANWPSIEQHGLLSTKALCEKLWSRSKAETDHIIHSHRPTALKHKGIIIRDQRPLNESKLVNCLKGSNLKPADWYAILNERVFFWTDRDRLNRFIAVYQTELKRIIEIDTARLLKRPAFQIELCHINSGATRMLNHFRSRASFQAIADFVYSPKNKPVEWTVLGEVTNILDLCVQSKH